MLVCKVLMVGSPAVPAHGPAGTARDENTGRGKENEAAAQQAAGSQQNGRAANACAHALPAQQDAASPCCRQGSAAQIVSLLPEDSLETTRGDFVYLRCPDQGGNTDNRVLAQIASEFWWDEKAIPGQYPQITEKVPPEDILRMGWKLFAPVRVLYNADFAFVRLQDILLAPETKVVVTTEHGNEIAQIIEKPRAFRNGDAPEGEIPLVRVAGAEDIALAKRNEEYSESAWTICREKIEKHKLPMNLVKTHALLEGNKILFFFTSEGRVDFRALAKDLASVFHTRIELRQIGVRDRSQLIGGCGVCGLILCCHSCKAMVQSVSIKMAKKQNLALNSSKISGVCGKLLCCLSYEYDMDEDAGKYQRNSSKVWLGESKGAARDTNPQADDDTREMADSLQESDTAPQAAPKAAPNAKKHAGAPPETDAESPW